MDNNFKSEWFKEYYDNIKGQFIEIDFLNKELLILDSSKQELKKLLFSKSIQEKFTIDDLLKTEYKVGDRKYGVYPDNKNNIDWLWVDNVEIIL